jgi:hypothetical protein
VCPVKHTKVSTIDNDSGSDLVEPQHWNAGHNAPYPVVLTIADRAASTWSNMPSALTEYKGVTRHRTVVDFTHATAVRMVTRVNVAGASGANLYCQYSIDSGTTWLYMDGTATPTGGCLLTSAATVAGSWINLPSGAKTDPVWLRIVGLAGDGAADPQFGTIQVQVK